MPLDSRSRRALLCCGLALLVGCTATTPRMSAATAQKAAAGLPASDPIDSRWPASVEAFRTTAAEIYLGNLDSIVSEHGRVLKESPSASLRVSYSAALHHRFRVLGRIEDAEQALTQLDLAVAEDPGHANARLLRATALGAFHRFADAEKDLAAARLIEGADREATDRAQREIDLALGRYARLEPEFAASAKPTPDFYEAVHRADLQLMQGDLAGADFQFRSAQIAYNDVSPVPLAWLHVQRGIASLRFGDVASARPFFASAHQRLPRYYLAKEHLAEAEAALGNHDAARKLYVEVIEQTGNPEFAAALASLESAAGNKTEAARRTAEARAAYAALYARHPDAYAQHYAEFLLEVGEPARALELAERNIALRQDVGSWILLAQAADANHREERACAAYGRAVATGRTPPELSELEKLAVRCQRVRE